MKKRIKKRREKKVISFTKKELIFNIISLVIIICIGLYFGIRSFYYYGRETSKLVSEAETLNGKLLSTYKIISDGDGLHQDTDGYYFKGNITNNYVMFGNRIFRVIGINNDGSIKIVTQDLCGEFIYGEDSDYKSSNLYKWLTKTSDVNSGIYYDTIPSINDFVTETKYNVDILKSKKVTKGESMSDYVTSLGIKDYTKAGGTTSYLNISKNYWLVGYSNDSSNLYVDETGSVMDATSYEAYGVRAVITLKKNLAISSGDGSINSPFVINQNGKTNYVDNYVKLGNDTYKVISDNNGVVKLMLAGYLYDKGSVLTTSFSSSSSLFNIKDKKNIGYYLNKTYYGTLTYNNIINDTNFYIGEISNDTGLSIDNIYNDIGTFKVGLPNMFDYNTNMALDDYYMINNTGDVSSMVYVYHSNGLVEETKADDVKRVVPVISVSKNIFTNGTGSFSDPYTV